MSNGNFIIFDTETTGFKPEEGHRIVEIGAIKMVNWHIGDDSTLQLYINPERDVPEEAFNVHGLSNEFLQQYPTFNEVAQEFIDFIGNDTSIIAHNASFDMRFINHHLQEIGYNAVDSKRVIDSLMVARKQFPSQGNSLDALCRRFSIDNSNRKFHGALLDAQLLSEVWIELQGGKQDSLAFARPHNTQADDTISNNTDLSPSSHASSYQQRNIQATYASQHDVDNHKEFLKNIPNSLFMSLYKK